MRRQPALLRCVVALCFSSAIALAVFEWRSPIPELVITPEETPTIDLSPKKAGIGQFVKFSWAKAKLEDLDRPFSGPPVDLSTEPLKADSVRLVLSLSKRSLEVRSPGNLPTVYEVAVGQDDWQTPTGEFTILSKLENPAWQHPLTKEEIPPGPGNPLGTRWLGFWTDGQAQIGFHGTDQEDLIGEAVSHGCVRMRNRDIQALYSQVAVGTPVTVIP